MKAIAVQRSEVTAAATAALALVMHWALCYPAAISRGYPPIHPFWETIAPYLAYLGVAFVPFFDDRLPTRRWVRNCFVPLACLTNGIVGANLASGTPSFGHLYGVLGGLCNMVHVAQSTVGHLIFLYPLALGLEHGAVAWWSWCREFTEPGKRPVFRFSVRALLCLVLIAALATGGGMWLHRLYEMWPRAQWTYDCRYNLKRMGLAMLQYHNNYGVFPPAYVPDSQGRPIHSWRVLLLPYVGQRELYDKYRFDEPWNGPHNRQLIDEIPAAYSCRWDDGRKLGHTSYVVITGPETAFPGAESSSIGRIRDGATTTIFVVEMVDSGIPWTAPRDLKWQTIREALDLRAELPLRGNHGRHEGSFVVFGDAHVRWIDPDMDSQVLQALITANGGETLSKAW